MQVHNDDGEPMAATFSVTHDAGTRTTGGFYLVIFESRGGGRNGDYAWGLTKILERIVSGQGILATVHVDSKRGRWPIYTEGEAQWPPSCPACGDKLRELRPNGCRHCDCGWTGLGGLATMEPEAFRKALGRRAAKAGRPQGAKGSGNATKRLELRVVFYSWQDLKTARDVETWLGGEVLCAS